MSREIHSSTPFVCNLCKTGIIIVIDQIFSHLMSKSHKKKVFEYNVDQTSTNADNTTCLTPNLIAKFKATCPTIPVYTVYADYNATLSNDNASAANHFPSLPLSSSSSAPLPPPPPLTTIEKFPPSSSTSSEVVNSTKQTFSRGRGRGRAAEKNDISSPGAQGDLLPTSSSTIASSSSRSWNQVVENTPPSFVPSSSSPVPLSINTTSSSSTMMMQNRQPAALASPNQEEPKILSARRVFKEAKKMIKNHLQAVNEICKCMRWDVTFIPFSPITPEEFRFQLVINKKELTFGEGRSQQEAKRDACENAMEKIKEMIDLQDPMVKENVIKRTFMDCYGEIAFKKIAKLRSEATNIIGNVELPSHFAAFIVTKPNQEAREGTVVAIGSGNQIIPLNNQEINEKKGCVLIDMRALTIARRSFQAFLCSQIKKLIFSSMNSPDDSLMVQFDSNGFVCLKQDYRVHLFLSHAPDGDAIFGMNDLNHHVYTKQDLNRDLSGCFNCQPIDISTGHGLLRAATCSTDGRSFIDYRAIIQRNKIVGNVEIMSLSDKLMLWCHVGLQGSLLSKFYVKPILPFSIQIGMNYNHGQLARALYARIPSEVTIEIDEEFTCCSLNEKLPVEYLLDSNKCAYLGCLTSRPNNYSRIKEYYSLNWFLNANKKCSSVVEVVDVRSGMSVLSSNQQQQQQSSRLCKAASLQRHFLLVAIFSNYYSHFPSSPRLLYFNQLKQSFGAANYCELKKLAKDYRFAKEIFVNAIAINGLGSWLKHEAANKFCLEDFFIH